MGPYATLNAIDEDTKCPEDKLKSDDPYISGVYFEPLPPVAEDVESTSSSEGSGEPYECIVEKQIDSSAQDQGQ